MKKQYLVNILLIIIISLPGGLWARENSTDLYKAGVTAAQSGDIDGAIALFKKVIVVSPYYSLGYYGLGKALLYKEGRLDDAEKHLKYAVKLDRKLARGHFYLGIALMLNKKRIHAIHAFNLAYRYDDSIIEALFNIGAIYDSMESRHKAKMFFGKYMFRKLKKKRGILF